jgi:hypothetical protein
VSDQLGIEFVGQRGYASLLIYGVLDDSIIRVAYLSYLPCMCHEPHALPGYDLRIERGRLHESTGFVPAIRVQVSVP